MSLDLLNGFAGIAALVNSLLMWPQIKALKEVVKQLHGLPARVDALEEEKNRRQEIRQRLLDKVRRPRGTGGVI